MPGNGWIKLYRQIQSHWLWEEKPFDKKSAWIDILLSANHKDRKVNLGNELITVSKGEFITSQVKLADKWGWSRTKVRNFLELCESDGMLEKQVINNKRTHLKVCNYGDYQGLGNRESTGEKQEENRSETGGVQDKNTNKNVKNVKNDKNVKNNNSNGDKFSIEKMDNGRYDYPDGYEKVYSVYPDNKGTKKAGWRKWAARRRDNVSNGLLIQAAKNYAAECQREDRDKKYVKHISTFFGPDEHWREYLNQKGGSEDGADRQSNPGEDSVDTSFSDGINEVGLELIEGK